MNIVQVVQKYILEERQNNIYKTMTTKEKQLLESYIEKQVRTHLNEEEVKNTTVNNDGILKPLLLKKVVNSRALINKVLSEFTDYLIQERKLDSEVIIRLFVEFIKKFKKNN